ncbi:hypothetical protein BM536_007140 [Streptomyces phaeoluteigriseus]|uniref:Uncharacterized protein n=1 Tax=Streptomyces phaeoluteigriseus TaxID=114686 RepID=A0A1V6MWD4_9ACTN|nr:hypothetical protein BM536_007140 [Streptomyces phaeoluteigriseus]
MKSGNGIYRYTNHDTNPWIKIPGGLSDNIPGGLSDIGAAADGAVWGVDPAGKIYKYTVCHREEALADGRVGEWTPGNKPTSVNT